MNMSQPELTKMLMALAVCYGVYKYAPKDQFKAMALGVAGVIVARRLPIVGPQLAA